MLVTNEKYDGVTNHQVVVALWVGLVSLVCLGAMAQVLCCTLAFLQWMLSICFKKEKEKVQN
jgi:hypothetical protein